MKHVKYGKCTLCEMTVDLSTHLTCPKCGEKGILDVIYDYNYLKKTINKAYFKSSNIYNIWRYKDILPIQGQFIEETLQVGWTPLLKAKQLAKQLHLNSVYIKDEGMEPTGSLKDRASIIAVVKAKERGDQTISCSSTGNAASSLAGNAAKVGLNTVIFVPKRAPSGKTAQLLMYGAKVVRVDGDYKAAFNLSKAAIDKYGWYNRNAAINPHLVEGKKTVAYEIIEQRDFTVPDWVVVSVGDGCTIAGIYKGFYDFYQLGLIEKMPKLLGVQAEGCAPIYKAFHTQQPIVESDELTLADSIAVGIPRNPIKALNAVQATKGSYVKVSDTDILQAMRTLGACEGLFAEPASAAGYAGLKKAVEKGVIKKVDSVVLVATGNGLKDLDNALKAVPSPSTIKPTLEALTQYLNTKDDTNEV